MFRLSQPPSRRSHAHDRYPEVRGRGVPDPLKRLPPFTIAQPTTTKEASQLLAESGGSASLYAGGTELLLAMKEGVLSYTHLIDVKTIPGMDELRMENGALRIGAAVTHAQIESSPLVLESFPALADVERRVANPRVRASGTLAGNLCFAEPHSDPATLLLCLDARVVVEGQQGQRVIDIGELLVGAYETSLAEDELVTHILVPLPAPGWRIAYEKFGVHERPTLGLAVVLETDGGAETVVGARIAVGCVAPTPRRSAEAERHLTGPISQIDSHLDDAGEALAAAAELIDDAEGSVDYKRQLIRVFLRRAVESALDRPLPGSAIASY
jgi:aerobic carbon-monoxide dehydrogenase medium subunit